MTKEIKVTLLSPINENVVVIPKEYDKHIIEAVVIVVSPLLGKGFTIRKGDIVIISAKEEYVEWNEDDETYLIVPRKDILLRSELRILDISKIPEPHKEAWSNADETSLTINPEFVLPQLED